MYCVETNHQIQIMSSYIFPRMLSEFKFEEKEIITATETPAQRLIRFSFSFHLFLTAVSHPRLQTLLSPRMLGASKRHVSNCPQAHSPPFSSQQLPSFHL